MSLIRPVDSRDAERVQLAIEQALAGFDRPFMGGNDGQYWVVVAHRSQFGTIAAAMQLQADLQDALQQTPDAAGLRSPASRTAGVTSVEAGVRGDVRPGASPRDPQTPARVA